MAAFLHQLEVTRACLPAGQPYAAWRDLSPVALEDLTSLVYGTLADEQLRDDFLAEERRLSMAYSLVKHLPAGRANTDEVACYQMLRKQLRKLNPRARRSVEDLERAVQDLLDESIAAQPAVDIFAVAGLDRPDISILDEAFLAGFGQSEHPDLQVRLLEKLLRDDLDLRRQQNLVRYRSFQQMLDEAIARYNNRAIQAADVVAVMIEIRQQQLHDEQRKQTLGLSDEELGFYDVVCLGAQLGVPTDDAWIAGLVHQVVEAVRANLKVDWTQAHRRDVHASVQSAVNRVLRKNHVRGEAFTFLQKRLMQQAEATYEQWPMAA